LIDEVGQQEDLASLDTVAMLKKIEKEYEALKIKRDGLQTSKDRVVREFLQKTENQLARDKKYVEQDITRERCVLEMRR
jgi:hypothetical protein